jgi:hypothetical protein
MITDSNTPTKEPSAQRISRREPPKRHGSCIDSIQHREREGILKPIQFSPNRSRYPLNGILVIEALAGGMGR